MSVVVAYWKICALNSIRPHHSLSTVSVAFGVNLFSLKEKEYFIGNCGLIISSHYLYTHSKYFVTLGKIGPVLLFQEGRVR